MNITGKKVFFVFFVLSLIPNEFYFVLGGIRLELYRVFLIFVLVTCLPSLSRLKLEKFEYLLVFFCIWFFLSYVYTLGFVGIASGTIKLLEVLIVYLIGRSLIVSGGIDNLKWSISVISLFFVIFIPFAVFESQTGLRITHTIAAKIAGTHAESFVGYNYYRLGLFRSSVVFSHPILYSIIAMTFAFLGWYLFSGIRRYVYSIGFAVALITSVTSAGIIMGIIQFFLIGFEYLARKNPVLRKLIFISIFVLILFLELFSRQGAIKFFLSIIALNPTTAYARYMQWEFAWDDVTRNWFFGNTYLGWTRPGWLGDSIDSYWLSVGVEHGLIALSSIVLFWYLAANFIFNVYLRTGNKVLHLMFCSLVALAFSGLTVAFFDRAQTISYMAIGMMVGYAINQRNIIREGLRK